MDDKLKQAKNEADRGLACERTKLFTACLDYAAIYNKVQLEDEERNLPVLMDGLVAAELELLEITGEIEQLTTDLALIARATRPH